MRELAERAYFTLCLGLGRLLRSAKYSRVRIVCEGGKRSVEKHRVFYAPLLVAMGVPLLRVLDTGVRVLPQRDWEERERRLYSSLHRASIRVDPDGTLLLPLLAGKTLASVLEDPALEESLRKRAIALAVVALSQLHRLGFTHGDAMAENVLIDLQGGAAHWFDFETVHDARRSLTWRRADDVRALLATCLVRTASERQADTVQLILDVYADMDVTTLLATSFRSVWRRSLAFHLAQAPLSCQGFQQIAPWLRHVANSRAPRAVLQ